MRLSKPIFALLAIDLALVLAAWWLAFWLRFNLELPEEFVLLAWSAAPWCVVAYALGLFFARVYRQVWSYIGLPELRQLVLGIVLGALMTMVAVLMLRYPSFPRSVLLLQPLLALVLLGAARAVWRTVAERRLQMANARPLLIVGSLQDASDALRALKGSAQWSPVGILSSVPGEVGRSLQGIPVLGTPGRIAALALKAGASTALIASPAGSAQRREVLMQAAGGGISLLTMPRPDEWLQAQDSGPRKIELEDLLGRDPVQLDVKGLSELFAGQTVLVTGAGGSIGSELCRQIARFGVARMVCVDVSEFAVYRLEQELRLAHPQMAALRLSSLARYFAATAVAAPVRWTVISMESMRARSLPFVASQRATTPWIVGRSKIVGLSGKLALSLAAKYDRS